MKRDFTYIDDIVSGIIKVYDKIPKKNLNFNYKKMIPNKSSAPFKIFNIGNNRTVQLSYLIKVIEKNLNLKSKLKLRKMQMGDVKSTCANIRSLSKEVSFRPKTKIEKGVKKFINWYKNYH
jgi:UDP-glucuronate 4-epimerase